VRLAADQYETPVYLYRMPPEVESELADEP
jgi:hypothetical protein